MALPPLSVGVCSWSLQVKSIPELKGFMDRLGINLVQIACGDPHHAAWDEGDDMPKAAKAAGFRHGRGHARLPRRGLHHAANDREDRRVRRPRPAARTNRALQVGPRPHPGARPDRPDAPRRLHPRSRRPGRKPFLDTLGKVSQLAAEKGVTVAFETGQETSALLRRTLDDLKCPNLKVNFDPANMLLYDKDDPIEAVELLAPDIRTVHVKDANRPTTPGTWGEEVPLGKGQTDTRKFLLTLKKVGYTGPLFIEREVGRPAAAVRRHRPRGAVHPRGAWDKAV